MGPGTAAASSTVADVTVGIPLLPVISVLAAGVNSKSICGSSTGSTTIARLVIGGQSINVANLPPNTTINLILGAKVILNEQTATTGPGGDRVLTVNAVHVLLPPLLGLGADVVVASASSDIHNCP
ncbi:MAG TPA: choice-of-anchor P family protein [Acidimicrobiales bacterium]|nr:choice-of-anchor P family protein [Acidimicrobiales bacterium]